MQGDKTDFYKVNFYQTQHKIHKLTKSMEPHQFQLDQILASWYSVFSDPLKFELASLDSHHKDVWT